MWYCGKCKNHVPAFKKMEIYKEPEFLVVHYKRFSHSRNTMFGTRKINSQIDFPVTGLDLSSYVLQNDGSSPCIYDLYAVSNHYGTMNGGHYTAMC